MLACNSRVLCDTPDSYMFIYILHVTGMAQKYFKLNESKS